MTRTSALTGTVALCVGLILAATAPAGAGANDTARFLAGLPPSAGSPLAALTGESSWRSHASSFNAAFKRIERQQLGRIRAWSKKHLTEHRPLMLYMFSGPDFLYANAFYPKAKTYLLSALEPVGSVPDLARLSRGARAATLHELRASLQTVLSYSFFITKDMKKKLRSGKLVGTLPVLYCFLARAGKTIHQVDLVRLSTNGTVVPRGASAEKGASPGVKIVFSGADGERRTLYYFTTDLSNGGLKRSGFRKFAESLGAADSLVKSASYLLHSGNFSTARAFLLERSAAVVQDDSGVPVRYFSAKTWKLHPFGRYAGPISLFAKRYQPEMRRLFARGRASKVDFGIGYRWRTHETNILLALKRPASAPKTE